MHRFVVTTAVILAVMAAGCGGQTAAGPGTSETRPTSAAPKAAVTVFFVKGEQFAPVERPLAAGTPEPTGAMEALLAGPTSTEQSAGIETTIPAGTTLTSVAVSDGTATVELASAQTEATPAGVSLRPARASQIVYTLTAIAGIAQVLIKVNGEDRATFMGSTLALHGPLGTDDLSQPVTLPAEPAGVPAGHAPADPAAVQERLVALHYLPADANTGTWDYRTSQAVMAFQGWQGIDRDGEVGPQTLAELETASPPKPAGTGTGHHVEVYRSKGVTLLVDGSSLVLAVHSSSGAAGYETPAGDYSVFRKEENSWSVPYQVWLPYASYFNGGIALHESADVPPQPASHGCVRLPAPEAPFVYDFSPIGTLCQRLLTPGKPRWPHAGARPAHCARCRRRAACRDAGRLRPEPLGRPVSPAWCARTSRS